MAAVQSAAAEPPPVLAEQRPAAMEDDAAAVPAPAAAPVTVRTPQIHWHGKSPVFTVDFHPHFPRLCATGGLEPDGTGGVHLWVVNDVTGENAEKAPVSFIQDLQGHEKSVNCLRFCPKGDLLASAGVEGSVVIWRRTSAAPNNSTAAAIAGHEKWEYMAMLRAQTLDVVDLSWSPSCTQLATASVDNTGAVLNLIPGKDKVAANLRGHDHFALGVAWDPKEEYILTVSSDGSSRFHKSKFGKWKGDSRPAHIACKMEFPVKKDAKAAGFAEGEPAKASREFKMFLDDSMAAHRRRAAWSPDGLFAVAPAGLYQESAASAPFYVSHVLARRNPTKSFALLPTGRKPSVAVRFCPTLYKLSHQARKDAVGEGVPTPEKLFASPPKAAREQDAQTGFNLPYKMIFAVATTNSILIYDTEQMKTPFMYVNGIHFDSLTDLAWSKDGQHLIATSKDGYCTMLEFAPGELGEPLEHECLPPVVAKNSLPGKSIDVSVKDPEDDGADADAPTQETAAQKVAELVAAPAQVPELVVIEYKVGEKVSARWKGGNWYSGTVTKINEPEPQEDEQEDTAKEDIFQLEPKSKPSKTYSVQFDDGDFDDAVPQDHIKQWEDKRARKRRIVPQVVKSVEEGEPAEKKEADLGNGVPAPSDKQAAPPSDKQAAEAQDHDVARESRAPVKESTDPSMEAAETSEPGSNAAGVEMAASSEVQSSPQSAAESAPKKRRIIPTTVTPAP